MKRRFPGHPPANRPPAGVDAVSPACASIATETRGELHEQRVEVSAGFVVDEMIKPLANRRTAAPVP